MPVDADVAGEREGGGGGDLARQAFSRVVFPGVCWLERGRGLGVSGSMGGSCHQEVHAEQDVMRPLPRDTVGLSYMKLLM